MGLKAHPLTKLPNVMTPIWQVEIIRDGLEEGLEDVQIARNIIESAKEAMGLKYRPSGWSPKKFMVTIDRIRREWPLWDLYLDDIAIERAYDGDRPVWEALTYYERIDCINKLVYCCEHQPFHRNWPHLPALEGVHAWANKVDEDPRRISEILSGKAAIPAGVRTPHRKSHQRVTTHGRAA